MSLCRAQRIDRVSLNTGALEPAIKFYTEALGFTAGPVQQGDPAIAALLGADSLRAVLLHRGSQKLELTHCTPAGAPYPEGARSDDLSFQHCALVTDNIAAAYDHLRSFSFTPISRNGPQRLPGGIAAFKFCDPEGHPLELIQFPEAPQATRGGIDHSAISVADADSSAAFYQARLGLALQARQLNEGPAQDALDNIDGVRVDVLALAAAGAGLHVELLGYRNMRRNETSMTRSARDLAASRFVFVVDAIAPETGAGRLESGGPAALIHDPDGHALLLLCQK